MKKDSSIQLEGQRFIVEKTATGYLTIYQCLGGCHRDADPFYINLPEGNRKGMGIRRIIDELNLPPDHVIIFAKKA